MTTRTRPERGRGSSDAALAARITRHIHRELPGPKIRASLAGGAGAAGGRTVLLDVPGPLAREPVAAWLATLVGALLGRAYRVAEVRWHRPSRSGCCILPDGSRAGIRATLTLRPAPPAETGAYTGAVRP